MDTILTGACIFAQSGGPTAVINASAYGVIRAALDAPAITRVLGAEHGIRGVLSERLFDMGQEDPAELALLLNTPSSALGSVRYKLADPEQDDRDYQKLLAVFKKFNVRYFFYNGGNDSMDTCAKISRYMAASGWACRVMGVPKTIDNDLFGTDHCPGYGSAARYIATSCMEVARDSAVYDTPQVTVVEIMGRNAGWLAASAALGRVNGEGPDMVCLPERDFDLEAFLDRVKQLHRAQGSVLVAVSEGIHDAGGRLISEYGTGDREKDAFGHAQLGGLAVQLAERIKARLGCKVRGIELSLLQRAGAHLASGNDLQEAEAAGREAVAAALAGETDRMIAFRRETVDGQYVCRMERVPLGTVANQEKTVPLDWITPDGWNVTDDFIAYALPLIQGRPERVWENGLPRYARLRKVLAE